MIARAFPDKIDHIPSWSGMQRIRIGRSWSETRRWPRINYRRCTPLHGLTKHVLENRQLDPSGQQVGNAHKALGLLYKVRKKHALALEHLTEAKRIFSQYGPSPALTRVETALVELQK